MRYLTTADVKDRYHISQTTLWRWTNDDKISFPQPMTIGRRKLFKEEEIESWERSRAKAVA
ncbi:helix-turn-helix transcriptional regulator [Rhizobium leguminosarum]|uniref:helix-turn-helix transcriptional regulator n=1 Tax=Rhizobium leguminosarum TaxID=384 RepID=UPI001C9697D1|nr:helix-turn-helix domain-containing protein [Rhizobium leguminosarum]MBY5788691.1 helix-turn-helix domain-containing protein [Rhizobium leguminosarum]